MCHLRIPLARKLPCWTRSVYPSLPTSIRAVVGLSGSGKSTIAGLVTRLYDPTGGRILFDGHNLRDLNIRDLRGFLSLVQQEPSLLDRSLLENIAHGLMNSSSPAHTSLQSTLLSEKRGPIVVEIVNLVRKAAILADADVFITALRQGYGTVVGSSGRLISGGQKQRVSLARALVKDPAVLILDGATASLDSRSEQRIQQAISSIASGRTMITIAHRLSTVTNADNIIVMHKGHIVEQGDHATLMAKEGSYAELVKLQTLGSASGKNDTTVSVDSVSKSGQTSTDGDTENASLAHVDPRKQRKSTSRPMRHSPMTLGRNDGRRK